MTVPPALLEFFQKEANEYLDRLEQLLSSTSDRFVDPTAFLTHARALRGSSTMTRLDGLAELTSTIERLATGLRDGELAWNQRLHGALRSALVEMRALVGRALHWTEQEQRRSRTQSVALASVAAGYLSSNGPVQSPSGQIVPINRFFPEDGLPAIVTRSLSPPITIGQRFRVDMAAAADGVSRETAALATGPSGAPHLVLSDAVRRSLLGLADVAESYGAASVSSLATRMARAPLELASERVAVQSFAQQLMDRELTDQELANRVRAATHTWSSATAPRQNRTPAPVVVPVESLLYRGRAALVRAREVRDELKPYWARWEPREPRVLALLAELSELLDLADPA